MKQKNGNIASKLGNYHNIKELAEKHHKDNMKDWLIFNKVFDKESSQGVAGLLTTKDGYNLVFKFSKFHDYVVNHEYTIMEEMKKLSNYCVHFCKSINLISVPLNLDNDYKSNPFKITDTKPVYKDVLLMEYISDSVIMNDFLADSDIPNNVKYSTIKQVILSITLAQKEHNFSHYDLHTSNIMIKKCNKNLVYMYILDDDNQFSVPTYGYYPVIIDYGYSYIKELNDRPLLTELTFTNKGFTVDSYDPLVDSRLFLVTASHTLKKYIRDRTSMKFRNIVKNLFNNIDIDWKNGWNKDFGNKSCISIIKRTLHKKTISNLYNKEPNECINLCKSLIILPLSNQDTSDIKNNSNIFFKEFSKIEKNISNTSTQLYILKLIVQLAREIRPYYLNKNENIFEYAKNEFLEQVNEFVSFFSPKNIDYELLFTSLYKFSNNIEGILYTYMENINEIKRRNKTYLPIHNPAHIYGIIETNIQSTYEYNPNTKVIVMDSINKDNKLLFDFDDDTLLNLNTTNGLKVGSLLYSYIK